MCCQSGGCATPTRSVLATTDPENSRDDARRVPGKVSRISFFFCLYEKQRSTSISIHFYEIIATHAASLLGTFLASLWKTSGF